MNAGEGLQTKGNYERENMEQEGSRWGILPMLLDQVIFNFYINGEDGGVNAALINFEDLIKISGIMNNSYSRKQKQNNDKYVGIGIKLPQIQCINSRVECLLGLQITWRISGGSEW